MSCGLRVMSSFVNEYRKKSECQATYLSALPYAIKLHEVCIPVFKIAMP